MTDSMNKFPHLVFVYGTLKRSEPNHVNYMKHPSRGTNSWIGNTALEFGGKNAILIYLFNFENFLPSTSILPYFWYIIIALFSPFLSHCAGVGQLVGRLPLVVASRHNVIVNSDIKNNHTYYR